MNIIIKLIRHRNHGGYNKSVMTLYARAVLAVQPSRMSNNLYLYLSKLEEASSRWRALCKHTVIVNHMQYYYIYFSRKLVKSGSPNTVTSRLALLSPSRTLQAICLKQILILMSDEVWIFLSFHIFIAINSMNVRCKRKHYTGHMDKVWS